MIDTRLDERQEGRSQDRGGLRPGPRWRRSSATSTSGRSSRTRSSAADGRAWGCSACPSPRSTAAWAATTSRCASPWRSWPGSTPRWRSPWRPAVGLGAMPIFRFGTEEQKQEWLPRVVAGADARRVRADRAGRRDRTPGQPATTAVLDGGEWVINGTKAYITNAGTDITGLITVTAVTGAPRTAAKQISTIIVPAGTPGLTCRKEYSKVGWYGVRHPRAGFDDSGARCATCSASRAAATRSSCPTLDEGRIAICGVGGRSGAGLRRRVCALRPRAGDVRHGRSAKYQAIAVQDRRHGGARAHRPPGLLRRGGQDCCAASRSSGRPPSPSWSPPTRPWTTPATRPRSSAAMGFMNETPVARFYRDAKILEIGEGTSEVQRMLIARELGL